MATVEYHANEINKTQILEKLGQLTAIVASCPDNMLFDFQTSIIAIDPRFGPIAKSVAEMKLNAKPPIEMTSEQIAEITESLKQRFQLNNEEESKNQS